MSPYPTAILTVPLAGLLCLYVNGIGAFKRSAPRREGNHRLELFPTSAGLAHSQRRRD